MRISDVPQRPFFEIGNHYLRKELHNQFKGQRQHGISTPASESFIFVFTDPSSEEFGYSDEFLDNGLFVYSGEGQVGNMTMEGGNKRILRHEENGDSLYIFEKVGEENGADVVAYDGEYRYVDHYWEKAPDDNGELREAVRFKLAPVDGLTVDLDESEVAELSAEELFERAKKSGSGETRRTASSEWSYTRSDLVRDFALQDADGVCQACEEEAPFRHKNGEPFLEVHHLYRVSDGGVDGPENVIGVCPNCHREIHYGRRGEDLNEKLIQKAKKRNQYLSV